MTTTLPAGWMLVPIEPTAEMLDAARRAPLPAVMLDSYSASENMQHKAAYAAMLAAAPAAPDAPLASMARAIFGDQIGAQMDAMAGTPTPPASAQDAITVSLDPDPRGVSVGVWQGSRCIYNGAHAVPVSAQDDAISAPYLQALADKVVIMNATGDPDLYREAVKDLLAAVRTFRPAPAAGDARAWQGLTDAERDGYVGELVDYGTDFVAPLYSVVESIEKRLREKNAASQQQEG